MTRILAYLIAGALVIGTVLVIGGIADWGVSRWGWYFTVPAVAFGLLWAWSIDRKDAKVKARQEAADGETKK